MASSTTLKSDSKAVAGVASASARTSITRSRRGSERSQALLKKTFQALARGGTISIAEFLVNADRTGPLNALFFAVNMLVNTDSGDTFSFEEISSWLNAAGFTDARKLDAPGPSPLILATKP